MSQQINLLNPAFRKPFDWLSATPLSIATGVMLVAIGVATVWASSRADDQERVANQRADALKAAQERLITLTKSIATSKPNQQLAEELATARAMLKNREEIFKVLEGGAYGNTFGFAEFLRGFARQTPNGLWLTGFSIGAGGNEMEIRGRMLNPASLPEYIRRLKTEKVFQGRSFASLTLQRSDEGRGRNVAASPPVGPAKSSGPTPSSPPAPLPSFVEFVLLPSAPNPAMTVAANTPANAPSLSESLSMISPINPGKLASNPAANPSQPTEKKP